MEKLTLGKVDPLKIRIIALHHKLEECEIQFVNEWTRFLQQYVMMWHLDIIKNALIFFSKEQHVLQFYPLCFSNLILILLVVHCMQLFKKCCKTLEQDYTIKKTKPVMFLHSLLDTN